MSSDTGRVNIVRRAELVEELRAEGADVVLLDGESVREEVAAATQSAPIRLALNAVGGENALRMAKTLAPDATNCDLWRHELAADVHSERDAHFQEPSLHRILGEQVVRRCHGKATRRNLCAAF